MATLTIVLDIDGRIGVRNAARLLVCLATIRDGLKIASEGEGMWGAPLQFQMPQAAGSTVREYLERIGRSFVDGNLQVEDVDYRDPAIAIAIGVINRFYSLAPDGAVEQELRLDRLSTGSLEGVFQDIITWLFGVRDAVRSVASGTYEGLRRLVSEGTGARDVGAGLVVVGVAELRATLDSSHATVRALDVQE